MLSFVKQHKGSVVFIALGILAILPFILISFYCNPVAGDDFNVANITRSMGFWQSQKYWYTTWTGRYFSTFFCTISPLVYGNFFLYKILPIAVIALLGSSFYLLIKTVLPTLSKWESIGLTAGFLSVLLLQMPSPSEGIFWAICSYTYQVPNALTLFFLWSVYQLVNTGKLAYFLLSTFFAFSTIGSTETSMLVLLYLQALIIALDFFRNRKINFYLLALLGLSALFALIVIKAPGNSLRQQHFPNAHRFPESVILTLKTSFTYLYKWLPVLLMGGIVVFEIIKRNYQRPPAIFAVHPAVALLIFLSLPIVCIFPVMWAVGNESVYLRVANVAYFFTVTGFYYFIFTLFFFLCQEYAHRTTVSSSVMILTTALLFIRFFTPDNTYQPNNVRRAYMDVVSGRARAYDKQFRTRVNFIANAAGDTCLVPEFTNIPSTLLPVEYRLDIIEDAADWRNKSLAIFFEKKVVLPNPEYSTR